MSAPAHPLETSALRRWRRLSAEGATDAAEAVLWDALAQEPNLPGGRWPWPACAGRGRTTGTGSPGSTSTSNRVCTSSWAWSMATHWRWRGRETRVIGVDPAPKGDPLSRCAGPARLYRRTSADFFAAVPADSGLTVSGFDLAFIDGDHRFDTVLDDFIGAERLAAPGAVLLLHDTVPLTADTAGREQRTGFHTGDGWKIVPCLRALRPDLHIVTLPTAPSGLTVVTGLDPSNTLLSERRGAIRESYAGLPPDAALSAPSRVMALGLNDPDAMRHWLAQAAGGQ